MPTEGKAYSDRDERIEVAAKAAHEAEREWASGKGQSWEECREVTREMRRVSACTALAAADAVQGRCICQPRPYDPDPECPFHGDHPADDRRMVDLDVVITWLRDRDDIESQVASDLVEREFGGPTPSARAEVEGLRAEVEGLRRRLVREMLPTRTATEMREDFGPDYKRYL